VPQRLRIFVSSPGDVPDERLRAELVIDKLAQDYSRFFTIESYRWEHEPMLASGHFQDAIEPPSKFDIVVVILWSRLGTRLPERTSLREYRGIDNRAPVTGTEWEYEEALRAARTHGAPDLLAFRNISSAPINPRDPDARNRSIAQLDALDDFWKRHFADRGEFLAAYEEYQTLDEFARRFEESLIKLIERRSKEVLAHAGGRTEPVWLREPFRGLEPYEFEHAAIFFGRDALATKATQQLAMNARAGLAFLLLSGASGTGKSSLVKAALVPRLMKPQRISGAAFLRRAIFRPGTGGADIFLDLAETLTRAGNADGVGLPELLAPGQDASKLASYMRSTSEPGYIFDNALGRLTHAARESGKILGYEQAKLILVVDQLEEIFTVTSITAEERRAFVALLQGFARSGSVWVVATLRADFWHRAAEMPELVALASGLGRLDVTAPLPRELAEMIRRPAEASGLSFEEHPETGVRLDALLSEHATAQPGVLPLLSFALDELYKDMKARGSTKLTYASYEALGELEGAIAKRADTIMTELPAQAQAALPRVLRALTTVSDAKDLVPVARPAALDSFAVGSPARLLVDAFTAARLLVAASEGGAAPTVRLAHEALVSRWQRAREQLAIDRRDLATRMLVEQQLRRYNESRPVIRRQLLLRNPDLANATDLARRWADELDEPTREFIKRSGRRARVLQSATAAAAVLFGVLAVVATFAARRAVLAEGEARNAQAQAEAQRQRADERANEALIGQSRSLGALVLARISASDPTNALALALEALPTSMTQPDRPYTPEAEFTLRVAYRFALTNDLERVWQTSVPDEIDVAALSLDAHTIALASGAVVRIIDRDTGEMFELPEPNDRVWAMRFLPRPNQLLVASRSTLRVFDLAEKKYLKSDAAPPNQHVCGWSYDGAASPEHSVTSYFADGVSLPERVRLAVVGPVNHTASENGGCVSSSSSPLGPLFRVWDTYFPSGIFTSNMLTSPTNTVTVTVDKAAKLWVQTRGNARQEPSPDADKFVAAIPTSDGNQAIAAMDDGRIAILDTTSLVRLNVTPAAHRPVANIDLSANNQQILIAYHDKSAEIWARRSFNELTPLADPAPLLNANPSLCQAPDPERHVDTRDGSLRVRITDGAARLVRVGDGNSETSLADLGEPNARARDATFSADEKRVIVIAEPKDNAAQKVILAYDAATGKLIDRKLREIGTGNQCVRMSADERHLSILDTNALRIADVVTGTLIREWKFPTNRLYRILGLAFNPAGDRIAVVDTDGTFSMIDVATGRPVDQVNWTFLAGTKTVPMAFDPSGRRVLFLYNNEPIAWSFIPSVQEMLDTARAYVPSCISPANRSDFYLADEPPAWCIELGKKPYDTEDWKQWLANKKAGKTAPMPSGVSTKLN
jgi:WD40 repeat protein